MLKNEITLNIDNIDSLLTEYNILFNKYAIDNPIMNDYNSIDYMIEFNKTYYNLFKKVNSNYE